MIKTIAKPADKKVTGCGECRSTCQSACKTSCTVGNQSCERITREEKIERKKSRTKKLKAKTQKRRIEARVCLYAPFFCRLGQIYDDSHGVCREWVKT